MTNASVVVHPFITKMRIPFFAISGFILAVQIVKTVVRNLGILRLADMITGKDYELANITLTIYSRVLRGFVSSSLCSIP
jgi:hypothetical protein